MKHCSTQLGARKNPDSPRVHGLRLSPNSSSAAVKEIKRTDDRNEASSSLPRRVRTFELPLTEVEAAKRSQPHARPVSSRLSRADEPEPRSSLMTRVLSRGGPDFHEYEKVELVESSRGIVTKSPGSERREGTGIGGAEVERCRKRGKWSVSPLWEAKTLLGVLKQQGLAGKGLIEAFEKWAPRVAGSSRADMSRLCREQTGRELSDYILVQQADKVVRYNQLPPDAEFVRRAVLNSCSFPASEATSDFSARFKTRLNFGMDSAAALETSGDVSGIAEGRACVQPREAENDAKKRELLTASKQHLLDNHDPNVLLSTNELATLIGFRPKTIRRWVSRKFLSYIRVGNRFRFRLAAVELFLAQREVRK
jgi:excisionase family DNA binding protein